MCPILWGKSQRFILTYKYEIFGGNLYDHVSESNMLFCEENLKILSKNSQLKKF